MAFQKGNPKPAGSGAVKGQKYKKTIARERAHEEQMEELRDLSSKYAGKSAREIMEAMNYDPLIHLIQLVTAEHTQESVRQKLLADLVKRVHPDLKSVEVTSNEQKRVEIFIGGELGAAYAHMDARKAVEAEVKEVIDAEVPVPNQIEAKIIDYSVKETDDGSADQ